jgi:peptide/nickel transport system substrate-binding protein
MLLTLTLVGGALLWNKAEVAGAAEEYPREETLILYMHARNSSPQQMNMYVPGSAYAWHQNVGNSNQLWYVNTDRGGIDWWLATGFNYDPDYKGMTINLRRGVRWSDGQGFDASDVVFTLNTLLKNPTMTYAGPLIQWVTEVKAIDNYTVQLKFKDKNPRFHLNIESTWGINILPQHVWDGKDPLKFTNWPPVHTGPYRIIKADVEEEVFQRIEDWWGNSVFGKPAPKYIIWRFLSPEVRIVEMSEHRLDAAYLAGPTDYLEVKRKNPSAMAWYDGEPYAWIDPCPRYMAINMRNYPYNMLEVRKAMSLAIDRRKVINVAYEGYGFVNDLMVPLYAYHKKFKDSVQDLVEKYGPTKYDPEAAKALLRGAGFTQGRDGVWVTPRGSRMTITAITGSWVPELLRYGQVAVDSWNSIGIEATAKPQEAAGLTEPWSLKTFEALTAWMCGSWYDPYYMFEKYHSKYNVPAGDRTGSNDAGYANPELDKIIDQLAGLPYDMDNPNIRKLYHDAMEILLRDVVFIPMSQSMFTLAQDTYYWQGWANSKDPFAMTAQWTPLFTLNILKIKPTGRK